MNYKQKYINIEKDIEFKNNNMQRYIESNKLADQLIKDQQNKIIILNDQLEFFKNHALTYLEKYFKEIDRNFKLARYIIFVYSVITIMFFIFIINLI